MLNGREERVNQGPELHKAISMGTFIDLGGEKVKLGKPALMPQFVFFASNECRPCMAARESLGNFARLYKDKVETIILCRGDREKTVEFADPLPSDVKVISDPRWDLGVKLRISSTPFALITDANGVIKGKGIPTSLAEFEWFLERLSTEANATVP